MAYLTETSQALSELRTEQARGFGFHLGAETAIGVSGMPMGEEAYSGRYPIDQINPVSAMEGLTGWPHVIRTLPYRPLPMNVVLHQDTEDRQMESWLQPVREHKRTLAREICASIVESIQRADQAGQHLVGDVDTDPTLYVVGDTSSLGSLTEAAVREGTESPELAAEAIEEICLQGLTFVICDGRRLPLGEAGRSVAVKTNHELELGLPASPKGRKVEWPVRGIGKVRLWKAAEVTRANDKLANIHVGIEDRLVRAGMSVARVVIGEGLDIAAADWEIAAAVRQAGEL